MSAISARPITAVSSFAASQANHSRKLQKPIKICPKRLDFGVKFGSRKSVSWAGRRRKQNPMMGSDGSVCASAREEGIHAFDQEALVEGSLSFGAGGFEATLNNLSKWLVASLFVVIALWRHDGEAFWATMGNVLNSILSITLKRVLNHERPISTLRPDPGMPSSHAQSFFYTMAFINLSMVEWYGINALTAILSGFFFIVTSYLSWLRVSQQLHTLNQVLVGAVIGSVFSILWFWLWHAFVSNWFISLLWVRVVVILSAIGFCLGFLRHIYLSWIMDEV